MSFKEIVGAQVLRTRSLFASDILHGLLPRASVAKSTSASLQFWWLPRTKPQFESRLHQWRLETRREAGTIPHSTSALQIFQRMLLLPLSPRELPRYDPQGARLQPLALGQMAGR